MFTLGYRAIFHSQELNLHLGKIESHLQNQRTLDQAKSLERVCRELNTSPSSDANKLGIFEQIALSV